MTLEVEVQEAYSRYADKLELVFREYESSLDLDIAFAVVPLTDEERVRLARDPDLTARIMVCDARVREELITDLRGLAKNSESDGVRLAAIKELGRTVYPKRFKESKYEDERTLPAIIIEVINE